MARLVTTEHISDLSDSKHALAVKEHYIVHLLRVFVQSVNIYSAPGLRVADAHLRCQDEETAAR